VDFEQKKLSLVVVGKEPIPAVEISWPEMPDQVYVACSLCQMGSQVTYLGAV